MQDIPRNELLDKLAAGWKCRRKSWEDGFVITKKDFTAKRALQQLLEDNWEGEPPGPECTGCTIIQAFQKLRNGAAFIRRGSGVNKLEINCCHINIQFNTDDILANDWEVWG